MPNWFLSRPFDLILSLCTQMTPFKTIWSDFYIGYPVDSFQDHLTWFYHCIPYWLLSRPFDLILSLCTQMTPFKTIWSDFYIGYPIDSFQDHLTWFYHCIPYWLLSRPFDLILSLCTPLPLIFDTPDYILRPKLCIFWLDQSWATPPPWPNPGSVTAQFYHCVPNWLLWTQHHQTYHGYYKEMAKWRKTIQRNQSHIDKQNKAVSKWK